LLASDEDRKELDEQKDYERADDEGRKELDEQKDYERAEHVGDTFVKLA
jgi:hypothetical protein